MDPQVTGNADKGDKGDKTETKTLWKLNIVAGTKRQRQTVTETLNTLGEERQRDTGATH